MIQWIITAYYILSDHNKGKIGSHNETLYLAINCDVRSSLVGEYFEEKLVCNKEVPLQVAIYIHNNFMGKTIHMRRDIFYKSMWGHNTEPYNWGNRIPTPIGTSVQCNTLARVQFPWPRQIIDPFAAINLGPPVAIYIVWLGQWKEVTEKSESQNYLQ